MVRLFKCREYQTFFFELVFSDVVFCFTNIGKFGVLLGLKLHYVEFSVLSISEDLLQIDLNPAQGLERHVLYHLREIDLLPAHVLNLSSRRGQSSIYICHLELDLITEYLAFMSGHPSSFPMARSSSVMKVTENLPLILSTWRVYSLRGQVRGNFYNFLVENIDNYQLGAF